MHMEIKNFEEAGRIRRESMYVRPGLSLIELHEEIICTSGSATTEDFIDEGEIEW